MATPNYGYEKRQRELAKKQKKEQKLREKAERKSSDASTDGSQNPDAATPAGQSALDSAQASPGDVTPKSE